MSICRYPGGKTKVRKQILAHLNQYPASEYREVFFGGGSIGIQVLLDPKIETVWINDKDVGVACMWKSIIYYKDLFKQRVLNFTPSIAAFDAFKEELLLEKPMPSLPEGIVDYGFKKLAIHQISYSGLGTKSGGPLGGRSQASNHKIDCRWSPNRICKKVDAMHNLFAARSVICTCSDFAPLILGGHGALLYLDPPYYVKGNELYQHAFSEVDHQRLAECLQQTKHNWVLSYDDCPQIRDLYSWAKIQEIDVKYSITGTKEKDTGKRLSRSKGELIIEARCN